ncbi:galactokinase isoform X2 [Tripterygium wilfordii]|uniref:Galactokinase isoform X2 n=1 Tax=Tripterygium wilfordii TaxID=458696 RepID=A0A7J7E207_TRIWF|nr:galactokinase isoform X2 [Tripterygium wilfordii]
MAAFDGNFPKKDLAQISCECKRHIGTQSGGMDKVSIDYTYMKSYLLVTLFFYLQLLVQGDIHIRTTLEGPFKPVIVTLDKSFHGNAVDLLDTDLAPTTRSRIPT